MIDYTNWQEVQWACITYLDQKSTCSRQSQNNFLENLPNSTKTFLSQSRDTASPTCGVYNWSTIFLLSGLYWPRQIDIRAHWPRRWEDQVDKAFDEVQWHFRFVYLSLTNDNLCWSCKFSIRLWWGTWRRTCIVACEAKKTRSLFKSTWVHLLLLRGSWGFLFSLCCLFC